MSGSFGGLSYFDTDLEEDGWTEKSLHYHSDTVLDRFVDDLVYPTVDSGLYSGSNEDPSDSITIVYFPDDFEQSGNLEKVKEEEGKEEDEEEEEEEKEEEDGICDVAIGTVFPDIGLLEPATSTDTIDAKPLPTEDLSHEEIATLLDHIQCPDCRCSTSTSRLDSVPNVRFCSSCQSCFGYDDSMDMNDLERLLSENKVTVRPTAKCRCGNDDVEKFVIADVDHVTGQPEVVCVLCSEPIQLEVVDCEFEGNEMEGFDRWQIIDGSNADKNRDESWSSKTQNDVNSMTSSNDNDVDRLFCRNCGVSECDLFEKRRDVDNRVTSFTCLCCDKTEVLPPQNPVVCPVCRNDEKERFLVAYGGDDQVMSAACMNCQNFLDHPRKTEHKANSENNHIGAPVDVRNDVRTYKRQVLSLEDISVGDHVTWHRDYVIWHHAIVTAVRSRDRKLTVVHYTGSLVRREGRYASVREEEVVVDPGRERVFVVEYETGFSPSDVVTRARSRLGEHSYNLLTRNCEHFAYWCKAGVEYSGQVTSFFRRFWKTCGSALSVGLREGAVNVARVATEGLPAKRVLGVGLEEGLARLRGASGASSGVAAGVAGGAVLFDVFLNLALEAGIFAHGVYTARRKWKEGEISREEYYRRVCQSGCECGGGFLGATGGGFLGQLAIPIPFLGSLVGCTLGTLIGRFVGSIIGKKISDKLIDKI